MTKLVSISGMESEFDLETLDVDAAKTALKEADVEFGGRSGPERLTTLLVENELDIPLIGGESLEYDNEYKAADEDEDEEEDEDEDEGKEKEIVPKKYRDKYGPPQHCGDEVAVTFKEYTTEVVPATKEGGKATTQCNIAALMVVCIANDIDYSKWEHKNVGMRRMNIGNVLRGKLRRGERIVIGDRVWEATEKAPGEPDENVASKMG